MLGKSLAMNSYYEHNHHPALNTANTVVAVRRLGARIGVLACNMLLLKLKLTHPQRRVG